jgi:integrase
VDYPEEITMARPLTQIGVDRFRPRAARFEVRDGHQQGLHLVVQPSGSKSWAVRTRIHGKPVKITHDGPGLIPLVDARDWARDVLKRIAEGEDPRAKRAAAKADTLQATIELYLQDRGGELRPRSLVETRRLLLTHWQPLHTHPLGEIARREVAARLLELKERAGPIASNRARSTLSALYAWAIRQGLAELNPVRDTGQAPERSRERVLSVEELRTIWTATAGGSDFDVIVRLLLLTGTRRTEAGGMAWGELDLERATWTIPAERAKNGRGHVVPLSAQAVELLAGRPRRHARDYLFGGGAAGFTAWSKPKRQLDRQCRLKASWRLHDLRRSFVTQLAEIGVAPHVIEALVNHLSGHKGGVAGIYNKATYGAEKRLAAQRWADHLLGAGEAQVISLPRR